MATYVSARVRDVWGVMYCQPHSRKQTVRIPPKPTKNKHDNDATERRDLQVVIDLMRISNDMNSTGSAISASVVHFLAYLSSRFLVRIARSCAREFDPAMVCPVLCPSSQ